MKLEEQSESEIQRTLEAMKKKQKVKQKKIKIYKGIKCIFKCIPADLHV